MKYTNTARQWLSKGVRIASGIDGRYLDSAFAALFFLWVATILALTPRYSPEAQLFPLLVGVPTFVVLLVILLDQVSPRFGQAIGRFSGRIELGFDPDGGVASSIESPSPESDTKSEWRRVFSIVLWILLSFAIIFVLGFSVGTFVFLLLFYGFKTDLSWKWSLVYSLAIWLFIFGIFSVVLRTPFYEGFILEDVLGLV